MSYYLKTILDGNLTETEEKVREALQKKGFGVLTEIDVTATFKKKLNEEIYPYKILGACQPHFAFKAITAEDKIGVMLPCNVILQEKTPGKVEVSAVDPMESMMAIKNPELGDIAAQVQKLMKEVVESLN